MKINQKKSKTMIFNFTHNYQFTTRLDLHGENVEVVMKRSYLPQLFRITSSGTAIPPNLWKVQMQEWELSEFGAPRNDLVAIYNSYIKSTLEQNAVVWQNKTVRIKKGCNYLQIYKTKYTVVSCVLRWEPKTEDVKKKRTRYRVMCSQHARYKLMYKFDIFIISNLKFYL